MSRLEWKEVEAPDFRNSSAGYLAASKLFGEAIGAAKDGLGDFQKTQTDQADNAVLNGLLKYQGDPKALESAMADGSFMGQFDPSVLKNLSAGTRQTLLSRPGQLLEHAVKTAEFGEQQKAIAQNDVVRAHQGDINTYTALRQADARDGTNRAEEFYKAAGPELQNVLSVGNFAKVLEGGQDQFQKETSIQKSNFDYGTGVRDDKEGRQATDLTAQLRSQTASLDDVDQLLNGAAGDELRKTYSPTVIAAARRALQGEYGGGAGAGSAGSGGAGGIANVNVGQAQTTVASTLSAGGLPSPVVAGFLGNFDVEAGYGGAQGDGGTAGGIAQWRKERRDAFVAKWGVDPTKADHETQAKHVVWELTTPEGRKAAGISDDQAKQILAAKTPGEAASLIDQYYERSDGKARDRRIAAANGFAANSALQTGLKTEVSGDQASDAARDWEENWSEKTTAAEVGASLSTLPLFKGEEGDYLTTKVDEVMAMAPGKINAATAGAILKRAKNGRKSSWNPDTWSINPWGSGVKSSFNEDRIKQEVALIADPKALAQQTLKTNALGQGLQDLGTAKANVQAAQAALTAKRQLAQRTGKKLNLSDEITALDTAQAQLDAANGTSKNLYDVAKGGENSSDERRGATPRIVPEAQAATVKTKTVTQTKAPPAAPKGAPSAKDINALLAEVRRTGHIANTDDNLPGIRQAKNMANNERAIQAAVNAALASGLPQFKGDGGPAHRDRVKNMLIHR